MKWLLALTVLLVSGCTAPAAKEAPPDFEAAMQMPGADFDIGNWTLRLLAPFPMDEAPLGRQDVLLVAHENGVPITNLDIFMEATMPAMGHGCQCDEVSPTEAADGVYVGSTDLFMHGQWQIVFDIQAEDVSEGLVVDVRA